MVINAKKMPTRASPNLNARKDNFPYATTAELKNMMMYTVKNA